MARIYALLFLCLSLFIFGCHSHARLQHKIVGGYLAKEGECSYAVSIVHRGRQICGGSIVSPRHVLTAAHCMFSKKNDSMTELPLRYFRLVAARLNLLNFSSGYTRRINKTILHEDYLAPGNDIAILEINEAFPIDGYILSIIPIQRHFVRPGTMCKVSGWGIEKYDSTTPNYDLQSVLVPVIDYGKCAAMYDLADLEIPPCICAGRANADACQGDSGGPLECNGYLTGIVYSGFGCGEESFPGLYTNISEFAPWIDSHISGYLTNVTTGVPPHHHHSPAAIPARPPANFTPVHIDKPHFNNTFVTKPVPTFTTFPPQVFNSTVLPPPIFNNTHLNTTNQVLNETFAPHLYTTAKPIFHVTTSFPSFTTFPPQLFNVTALPPPTFNNTHLNTTDQVLNETFAPDLSITIKPIFYTTTISPIIMSHNTTTTVINNTISNGTLFPNNNSTFNQTNLVHLNSTNNNNITYSFTTELIPISTTPSHGVMNTITHWFTSTATRTVQHHVFYVICFVFAKYMI